MIGNNESLSRQWLMLKSLPRYPKKISVRDIILILEENNFAVSERTVQRDLHQLSSIFPLVVDDREKPFGWSWQKDAPSFDLPSLSVAEAVTLLMVEQHLASLLPSCVLNHMNPYFSCARRKLESIPHHESYRSWSEKVVTLPPSQPLLPPNIDPDVHSVISTAIFEDKQVDIEYKKRGEKDSVSYRIHPLGLIQRGSIIYLDVRIFNNDEARTLAMHRIKNAVILDYKSIPPANYSLNDRVRLGVWDFGNGDVIDLVLRFKNGVGDHLLETPLSDLQHVEIGDNGVKISVTIPYTPQLKWWILGFGDGVAVISPSFLREDILTTAHNMIGCHKEFGE